MSSSAPIKVIDGHNDTLLRMQMDGISFFDSNRLSGIDLPKARQGSFAGGFFAVYIWAEGTPYEPVPLKALQGIYASHRHGVNPPQPDLNYSRREAIRMMASLFRLERESEGALRVVRTGAELHDAVDHDVIAAILHMEGAEPIDPELNALEVYYQAGLRSLGIVHSRPNVFGTGVPIQHGISPDTGPGLTEVGKELVRACNRLRIMIDLSHLNEKGFWDVSSLSDAPLVASHSCSHAICPAARNLTDRQLRAIGESDGMVGLNFHVGFLRPDGNMTEQDTPIDIAVQHIDHLVEVTGIDHVGMGSDFEYVVPPSGLAHAGEFQNMTEALRARGYSQEDLEKLMYRNWMRVLRTTWGT